MKMVGGEFILHGRDPRVQTTNVIINDPKFPGLEGVTSPVSFKDEWYSLKDFQTDMHVILTLDTAGMKGEPYQRPPYPMTWARMHGKGRVFFTAIGDLAENWEIPFFVNLLGGGIRWAIGDVKASNRRRILKRRRRGMRRFRRSIRRRRSRKVSRRRKKQIPLCASQRVRRKRTRKKRRRLASLGNDRLWRVLRAN